MLWNNNEILDDILDAIFRYIKNLRKGLIERKILREVVVKSLKRNTIQIMCLDHLLNDISSGLVCIRINNNIPNLMNGRALLKTEETRPKVHDDVDRKAVAFILHRDHIIVTTIAWGKVNIRIIEQ